MASRQMSGEEALDLLMQSDTGQGTEPEAESETESSSEGEQEVDSGSEFSFEASSTSSSDTEGNGWVHAPCVALPTQSSPARLRGHARNISVHHMADESDWVPPAMAQPVVPPFTGVSGCTENTDGFEPIDFFNLFVDDGFISDMVEKTNLYAEQFLRERGANLKPNSRAHLWVPTTSVEMRTFRGLTLLLGQKRMPSISLYWSTEPAFASPFFPATMSKDRFLALERMLHFNDNSAALPRTDPYCDRLFKFQPLLKHFAQRFSEVYVPSQNMFIDKPLVLFKNQLLLKQYISSKRAQYGIKVYMLCESTTGYAYNMKVYTGKDLSINPPGCPAHLGTSERIVWDLATSLFHKGHQFYVDNFYTGIPLFKELYNVGTLACSRIRSNRKGFPRQLVCKKLDKGACMALWHDELLALKFCHRRDVHILRTIHDESTSLVTVRGQALQVLKPKCILDYNRYMGEVDKIDQLLELYHVERTTCTWYKKLAVYLMHLATYNAYVVDHAAALENKLTFLKFELAVLTSLTVVHVSTPNFAEVEDVARLQERHFADYVPTTPRKTQPYRRCKVCTKQGRRRDTRVYCPQCPSKPALCLQPCFALYHTKRKYWEIE
ncbi:piggyBac transposable element-derived protein 4-like [Ambystoma mexicanum]|uniref:piggyBac transposable element-derived protein 4-like n=1 Tax=Ambystoma mexicanum TaxID=8296 RepID=UPI0037E78AE2